MLALSDLEQTFSYCLLDTPIPMFNYVAHVRLLPVTDGDRTFWHWESRFTTRPGDAERITHMVAEDIYQAGFEAIRKTFAGGRMSEPAMPIALRNCASAAEAAAALTNERGARYLGGGTLVMRDVNEGDLSFSTIVRTGDRALTRLDTSGQRLVIGAGVTYAMLLAARELSFLHPVARSIGGPAVRNMGTVGGNLFAPAPFGDLATALLALDATVQLHGGYSPREIPLEEFLGSRERNFNALVLAVSFPRPASAEAFRYRKVARVKPKGASVITIAAHVPLSGGRVVGARIAFGAMGATPLRAKGAERALEGRSLDAATIAAAAHAALEGLSPQDDALASAWYRREVAGVHLRRLLSGEGNA